MPIWPVFYKKSAAFNQCNLHLACDTLASKPLRVVPVQHQGIPHLCPSRRRFDESVNEVMDAVLLVPPIKSVLGLKEVCKH